ARRRGHGGWTAVPPGDRLHRRSPEARGGPWTRDGPPEDPTVDRERPDHGGPGEGDSSGPSAANVRDPTGVAASCPRSAGRASDHRAADEHHHESCDDQDKARQEGPASRSGGFEEQPANSKEDRDEQESDAHEQDSQ